MAYQTYTTEGYVCGSFDSNTSDRYHYIFTRDIGMVRTRVRSVREERSKLRYGLQDFSHVNVSLVRGRHDWRVVGIEPIENYYFSITDRSGRKVLHGVTNILRRLIHGEEKHERLFAYIIDSMQQLLTYRTINRKICEQLLTFHILHELGYIAPTATLQKLADTLTLHEALDILTNDSSLDVHIQRAITHGIEVSGL